MGSGIDTTSVAVVVLAITATVYYRTLHPSVAGGDSGELMCVSHEFATPHPPGYPTFAILTHYAEAMLTSLVPSLSAGMAQNSFHAALSTLAVLFLYCATVVLGGGAHGAALASLLFAFAPNVWTYAIVTEVFPLNNFFMTLLVLLAALYAKRLEADKVDPSKRMGLVYSSALVCGLSMTNQHTSILFVVPIVLWVFATTPSIITNPVRLVVASICFFAGLLPYAYLPYSALFYPSPNSWGSPSTWDGFATHFFRKEYGTFSLASQESNYRVQNFGRTWRLHLGDIQDQLGYCCYFALVGAAVALFAAFNNVKDRFQAKATAAGKRGGKGAAKKEAEAAATPASAAVVPIVSGPVILILTWLAYNNFFNYLSNLPIEKPLFYGVQQRFWLQPLIIVCIFVGLGFDWIVRQAASKLKVSKGIVFALAVVVALVIGGSQIAVNYKQQDESENFYVRDFGRMLLAPLPKNAIVFTMGDIMINSARYVQVVEGFRPDIRILDQELMTFSWYNDVVKQKYPDITLPGTSYYPNKAGLYDISMVLDKNRDKKKRRVFLAYSWKEGDDSWRGRYTTQQFGMTHEVITEKESQQYKAALKATTEKGQAPVRKYVTQLMDIDLSAMNLPPIGKYPPHAWEIVVVNDLQQTLVHNAFQLMDAAQNALQGVTAEPVSVPFKDIASRNWTDIRGDDSLPLMYRALLRARMLFREALSHDSQENPKLPPYVRRNLGVCLQSLVQTFHQRDKTLLAEARDVFKVYLKDGAARGEIKTKDDRRMIEEAVRFYEGQL